MKDNPQMNQRDNLSRRTNLDILRIILTILVVVGHGTYYRIVTEFGGVDYVELMANSGVSDSLFHVVANKLTTWIY
ncbi:MAG: hypothetical protein J6A08_09675, partial [Lachnospiraceae bacterium]|nr:hypothetical protein [Lachnospiraceae bacterium]